MAKVLLVSYPGYPSTPAQLVANSWLAGMAGALVAAGHETQVIDYGTITMMRRLFPEALTARLKPLAADVMRGGGQVDQAGLTMLQDLSAALEDHQAEVARQVADEVLAQARRLQADVVLFELYDGDGFPETALLAQVLRDQMPGVLLGAFGRRAAWFRGLIFKRAPQFDAIIFGDPEQATLDLAAVAEKRMALDEVSGIAFSGGENQRCEITSLDDLPLPNYDPAIYPAMAADEKIKMGIITESRGCRNRCAFCLHPWEDGEHQRLASAGAIVRTMEALQQQYGFSVFRFAGASTPGELMYEVAKEILNRGLKVQYNSFGHFRSANPDHFTVLAQSGLYSLFFGLESGSQQILDKAVHKGIKLDKVRETMAAAKAAGIFSAASMIVPLPFDTEATLAESLAFVTDLKPDSVPLQFPGLMPGTAWLRNPERYNIELGDAEQFLLDGLDYKIKLLFPPQFWTPLAYTLNGLSFHEFTAITIRFAGQLEQAGLLTNFSHTLASIAQAAGLPPRELRDSAQLWCVTGDAEAMGAMVARANGFMLAAQ